METLGGPLTPRLLYRVAPDGTHQLVRGGRISTIWTSVPCVPASKPLARISGAATTPAKSRETVLAPALLLDDITIRRANEKNDKLPFYPSPN